MDGPCGSPSPFARRLRFQMLFNSYFYGLGNGGHAFTQPLTGEERWALIESMKTL